jgi:hypothetical protein
MRRRLMQSAMLRMIYVRRAMHCSLVRMIAVPSTLVWIPMPCCHRFRCGGPVRQTNEPGLPLIIRMPIPMLIPKVRLMSRHRQHAAACAIESASLGYRLLRCSNNTQVRLMQSRARRIRGTRMGSVATHVCLCASQLAIPKKSEVGFALSFFLFIGPSLILFRRLRIGEFDHRLSNDVVRLDILGNTPVKAGCGDILIRQFFLKKSMSAKMKTKTLVHQFQKK